MYTVLKCHDFAITQFLREINYVDYTSANYANLLNTFRGSQF